MRGLGKILLVATLAMPVGWLVVAPASAASTISCSKLAGKVTFVPALPKISSSKLVLPKIGVVGGKLSTCTGVGGASGTIGVTLNIKTKTNCKMLATGSTNTGTSTIKWVNGKSTTLTESFKSPPASPIATVTGKVTKGLPKVGAKLSVKAGYKLSAKGGNCVGKDLSYADLVLGSGSKFVIK